MKRYIIAGAIGKERQPDYEAMWSRIECARAEADYRSATLAQPQQRKRNRKRLPAAIAAVSVLLAAAPATGSAVWGWDGFLDRIGIGQGIQTAIESGFGERIEKTTTSEDASLTLHGVVTDELSMDVLFTLQLPPRDFDFEFAEFERQVIQDDLGRSVELHSMLAKDEDSGKLRGYFETVNDLKKSRKNFELTAQNLSLYKRNQMPVALVPDGGEGQRADLQGSDFSTVSIESVIREGDVFTVQYRIALSKPDRAKLDPRLVLLDGGTEIEPTYQSVLPPADDSSMIRQNQYKISDEALGRSAFQLSYLQETALIPGKWQLAFEADGRKASQVSYSKDVDDQAVDADGAGFKPGKLVVSPMQIRLYVEKSKRQSGAAIVHYQNVYLQVGDKQIRGGFWDKDNGKTTYYRFESPEWYKDWSGVPMKLVMTNAISNKQAPAADTVILRQPSIERQTIAAAIDGIPVMYTYYRQGDDLVVESRSDDPSFGGISQSYVVVGGKNKYPIVNPLPPGGNGTNIRVETYAKLGDGDVQLNPGNYTVLQPDKTLEIPIQ